MTTAPDPTLDGSEKYRIYGLSILSPVPLPGVPPAEGGTDVEIRYGSINQATKSESSENVVLTYDDIGSFQVSKGSFVTVEVDDDVDRLQIRRILMGPIMGAILHQRGHLVLHASAVEMNGHGVVFLGPRGAGKSTLTAACLANGHTHVTDDITPLQVIDGRVHLMAGPPLLKLEPDIFDIISPGVDRCSELLGSKDLFEVPAGTRPSEPVLDNLYFIERGELRIESMSVGEAMSVLVGFTYTHQILDASSLDDHFEQCVRLANSADIRHLWRPEDLTTLPEIVHCIEQDLVQ